jgi:SAM-dependent methyltransferase
MNAGQSLAPQTLVPPMNCDALAPFYSILEHISFGPFLERARFKFLPQLHDSRRALLCGDGDGRFLARLLQENPTVEVDFVDLSGRMIELAAGRASNLGPAFRNRVCFHHCDIRDFSPATPESYDLIAAHFFLDCFGETDLRSVIQLFSSWATPNAQCIVSEFREIPAPPARYISRAIVRSLYAAFRLTANLRTTRLPDYPAALQTHGFRLQQESFLLHGLLHSSLWGFEA